MRRIQAPGAIVVLAVGLAMLGIPTPAGQPALATSIEVTNTNDTGPGSLRQAIVDANNNPGPDTITFDIPPCGGACVIQPATALPYLSGGETTIDGYTQPGAQAATATTSATIQIQIDGTNIPSPSHGLYVTSAGNSIRGLSVVHFQQDGIRIVGPLATGNVVAGNHIGADAAGTGAGGNTWSGVYLGTDARYNTVGGDAPAARNVISGNDTWGVNLVGSGVMSNTVSGNYVGLDASGTAPLPNDSVGIHLTGGTRFNTIGGDAPGRRNVVSGNTSHGIGLSSDGTNSNTVSGNYVGTDASGAAPLPNSGIGVSIGGGAQLNTIGGDGPGQGNVIAANGAWGVGIVGTGTMSNTVSGNYIGTDATGTAALANAQNGVYIHMGAANNIVGPGNVISGNGSYGVLINAYTDPTAGNTVFGNYIGTDATGLQPLGNGFSGVVMANGTKDNTIGPGNVIAYNTHDGVEVEGGGTLGNVITRNCIAHNILGIDLFPGANGGVQPPVITGITFGSIQITGTACPFCTVELFTNSDADGEGETYAGSATADGNGGFTLTPPGHLAKPFLTATATDPISGTSEFSGVYDSGITTIYLPAVLREQ
jgi:hypothetical protein